MTIIAIENAPGETRAAAFDSDDLAYSVFSWREPKLDPRARVGDVHEARVTRIDRGTKGFFLELATGEIAYCHQRAGEKPPHEGARKNVRIESEGWAEKSTRVSLVEDGSSLSSCADALKNWKISLPLGANADVIEDCREASDLIDLAFEEALSDVVTPEGGGQIIIQETRALTSVDVDSFGRIVRGGAQDLNLEAVATLARQVALRRIGGIVVADLIGAASGNLAADLVRHFRKTLKKYDRRTANILPINRLGLFEFSMPRRSRPVSVVEIASLSEADKSREDILEIWRDLSRTLRDNPAEFVEVKIDPKTYSALQRSPIDWAADLSAQFGARFKVTKDDDLNDTGYEVIV